MTSTETTPTIDDVVNKVEDLSIKDDAPATEAAVTEAAPSSASEATSAATAVAEDDETITPTVFKSTDHFSVVHPLTNPWTLWYLKPPTAAKEDWKDLLTKVVTVSTIEEFWGAVNNLPKVSELPLRSDYALFKEGIRPEWEDSQNSAGGKWLYQFKDQKSYVDELWLNCLLAIIGGTMDTTVDPQASIEQQEINGIFVNVRKAGIRFNVWTKSRNFEKLKPIGLRFKKLIKIQDTDEVEFTAHSDGRTKQKFTV